MEARESKSVVLNDQMVAVGAQAGPGRYAHVRIFTASTYDGDSRYVPAQDITVVGEQPLTKLRDLLLEIVPLEAETPEDKPRSGLTLEEALKYLREGGKIRRKAWANQFTYIQRGRDWEVPLGLRDLTATDWEVIWDVAD